MLLAVRIGWFALPLTVGPALAHGLADVSTTVQVVASILAWLAWGGGTAIQAPGDYDGDGKTDPAVYFPATGQ